MGPRHHVRVFTASAALFVVYAAAMYGYSRWTTARGDEATNVAALESAAEGGTPAADDARESAVYFEVTTSDGQVHVERVTGNDPSLVLLRVSERYGAGASIRRLVTTQGRARHAVQQSRVQWLPALFVFPLGLLLAAVRMQRRAKEVDRVWAAIRPMLCADAATLMREHRLSPARLSEIMRAIERRGLAKLVWDERSGRIYDDRLALYHHPVPFCPRCNAPSNMRVRADLCELPSCPECFGALDRTQLAPLTRAIAARLATDRVPAPPNLDAGFSPRSFAFWVVAFPPVAIVHALRAAD